MHNSYSLYPVPTFSSFFLNKGKDPEGSRLHYTVGLQITTRTSKKQKITTKSLAITKRTLTKEMGTQSGPTPPRTNSSTLWPSTPPPGTRPLGDGATEDATPELRKGLRNGTPAWRLKMLWSSKHHSTEWPLWLWKTEAQARRR